MLERKLRISSNILSSFENHPALKLWLDATFDKSIEKGRYNSVYKWHDKKGSGIYCIQEEERRQPIIFPKTFKFNGDKIELYIPDAPILDGEFTIITATNSYTQSKNAMILGDSASNKIGHLTNGNLFVRIKPEGKSDSTIEYTNNEFDFCISCIKRDEKGIITSSMNNPHPVTLFNGEPQKSSITFKYIGSDTQFNWKGELGEILIFDVALQRRIIGSITQYLKSKWQDMWLVNGYYQK